MFVGGFHFLHEFGGAGLGDGADIGNHFFFVHADTVITNNDGVCLGIEFNFNLQLIIIIVQTVIGQGFKAQLIAGIGSIGNQFSKENLLVRIERVDHQMKQLFYFSLKSVFFYFLCCGHIQLLRVNEIPE